MLFLLYRLQVTVCKRLISVARRVHLERQLPSRSGLSRCKCRRERPNRVARLGQVLMLRPYTLQREAEEFRSVRPDYGLKSRSDSIRSPPKSEDKMGALTAGEREQGLRGRLG